ncbi:hypothetical protein VMT65_06630 [Nocardia sp. CDC153]|uniref:hypothetical protein n=1 Tax=Nocardia sp. CDC153 TaxID=3112167 RepID=UPI002DB6D69D|nr:hypothetical protein [Nocardia sp. CDC153]MEC3952701.1 hypothetical protein [Nocardia sp. CDC153]
MTRLDAEIRAARIDGCQPADGSGVPPLAGLQIPLERAAAEHAVHQASSAGFAARIWRALDTMVRLGEPLWFERPLITYVNALGA